MWRRKRARKQRVLLRNRRREQLKENMRSAFIRGSLLMTVAALGAVLFAGRDSFASRFIREHTPVLEIKAPQTLPGLPIAVDWPRHRFWLWLPGSTRALEKRLLREHAAVRAVRVARHYRANRVVMRLEPRKPLVLWKGMGMDRDGVVFPVMPGTWAQLPQADFSARAPRQTLGRWLEGLSARGAVWTRVADVRDDPRGEVRLILDQGTEVFWGEPEAALAAEKANTLARVLEDASQHFGGAASADLRFFDQGRIIVRPKQSRSP